MSQKNKTIPFTTRKKRTVQILTDICREGNRYYLSWNVDDETITEEEICGILLKIQYNLAKEIKCLPYKEWDFYKTRFTLICNEKENGEISYICIPQDMKKEKLLEYLSVSIALFKEKNAKNS